MVGEANIVRFKKISSILALGALLALVGAPSALAQNATQEGYSEPGGVVQSQVDDGSSGGGGDGGNGTPTQTAAQTPAQASSSGDLPFTGMDLGLVAGAGLLLLAAGFGIRRVTRSQVA